MASFLPFLHAIAYNGALPIKPGLLAKVEYEYGTEPVKRSLAFN